MTRQGTRTHQTAGQGARTGGGHADGDGRRPRDGVITGYLFKLLRESAGLTQDELAERLGVDRNTVQGWESGRRSLTSTRAANLVDIKRRLRILGAAPELLDAVDVAMEADCLLAHVLQSAPETVDPAHHPLATWVITRDFTEMLEWPFTGEVPRELRGTVQRTRRGPVAAGPVLGAEERGRFFLHLRNAAERSLTADRREDPAGPLLRRQASFLLSWDRTPSAQAWLDDMERAERRRAAERRGGWSPAWAAARSMAVAQAQHGDPEPLRHFIASALASDECEAANLNYWAYWVGETRGTHSADSFMASGGLGRWHGGLLLRRLNDNLAPETPYVDLCVHAVWALVQRRGHLLAEDPALTASLQERVARLLDEGAVSAQSRRELEQVRFALSMARHAVPGVPILTPTRMPDA